MSQDQKQKQEEPEKTAEEAGQTHRDDSLEERKRKALEETEDILAETDSKLVENYVQKGGE